MVRTERPDSLVCGPLGGRWDEGTAEVLYTSETREGALAEWRFQLYQRHAFPRRRVRYEIFELAVSLGLSWAFVGLEELATVGLG